MTDDRRETEDEVSDAELVGIIDDRQVVSTSVVAAAVDHDEDAVCERLHALAETGLIERRETTEGCVWLTWSVE